MHVQLWNVLGSSSAQLFVSWWLHNMETISTSLSFCKGKPLVTRPIKEQWCKPVMITLLFAWKTFQQIVFFSVILRHLIFKHFYDITVMLNLPVVPVKMMDMVYLKISLFIWKYFGFVSFHKAYETKIFLYKLCNTANDDIIVAWVTYYIVGPSAMVVSPPGPIIKLTTISVRLTTFSVRLSMPHASSITLFQYFVLSQHYLDCL